MLFRYGAGNDHARGSAGDDLIVAGAGNDVIEGGAGFNRLHGGAGADAFYFGFHRAGSEEGPQSLVANARENVLDFQDGQDLLNLGGFVLGPVQGAVFIGGGEFQQAWTVQVRAEQVGTSTLLQIWAPDGLPKMPGTQSGPPRVTAEIVLEQTDVSTISAADFAFG